MITEDFQKKKIKCQTSETIHQVKELINNSEDEFDPQAHMIDEENPFIQVIPWPLRGCLAYTHTHTNRLEGGGTEAGR